MSVATARRLAIAFFVLQAVAVPYPGFVPFSRIEPRVLGLPFALVWPTAWIVVSGLVLWALHAVESRRRED